MLLQLLLSRPVSVTILLSISFSFLLPFTVIFSIPSISFADEVILLFLYLISIWVLLLGQQLEEQKEQLLVATVEEHSCLDIVAYCSQLPISVI